MKRLVPIIIIVALLIGGYFALRFFRQQRSNNQASQYQTVVAARGSLTATVGATGSVRPNQSAILTWGTSGIIGRVDTQEGSIVQADQELAMLEDSSLTQNVILAQADLINAQKALDDLRNSTVAQTQALQAVYQAQLAVIASERALDVFDAKKYKDDLDKTRNDVVDKEDDLEQAREDFEPYENWDEDNETRKRYEQALDDAQNAYDEAIRKRDELILQKSQAEASLEAARAQLADAEREYERLQNGPNPDDVAVLEARIAAAQATLDLARLDAPFEGTITSIETQVGDKVAPGSVAFRLDDLSRLLVDVRVSEVDINRVLEGQPVELTFDAILGKTYNGVVDEVSLVGEVVQGVIEFPVTVVLSDPDEDVKPGMTAAVNIVVDQFDNILMVPNRAVRIVDGQRVVYLLQDDNLVTARVTLGASSDSMSEVVDGDVQAGDVIVLNPPQVFEGGGPPFGR